MIGISTTIMPSPAYAVYENYGYKLFPLPLIVLRLGFESFTYGIKLGFEMLSAFTAAIIVPGSLMFKLGTWPITLWTILEVMV